MSQKVKDKIKKITNSDEAYEWILKNKHKLSRKKTIEALNKYCLMAGFTKLTGEDCLWCLENF